MPPSTPDPKPEPFDLWRAFTIEVDGVQDAAYLVCRLPGPRYDQDCEWSSDQDDQCIVQGYLTLGQAYDAALRHISWHQEIIFEDYQEALNA